MASGKTHEKINLFVLFALIFIWFYVIFKFSAKESLFELLFPGILGFVVGTFYLGPDLDIVSRPYNRWGFLKFIWKPYQKFFKHRSIFTHGIILGDLIRFLYLFATLALPMILLIYILSGVNYFKTITSMLLFNSSVVAFLLGIVSSSAAHTITDFVSSRVKKK